MNERFECAWQSLRPVPQVTIDFGDGRKLSRTLNGNIATWICTSEGGAIDLIPGLVSAQEYRSRLEAALLLDAALETEVELPLLARLESAPDASDEQALTRIELAKRKAVASFHRFSLEVLEWDPSIRRALLEEEARVPDMRKFIVEGDIKRALLADLWFQRLESEARATASSDPADLLAQDTEFNRDERYLLAHALLAEHPLATPQSLSTRAYCEILHVQLADPWLGLAPYVLGGESGRDGGPGS